MFRRKPPADPTPTVSPADERDKALSRMVLETQAVIHFAPDATILFANDIFVSALGYDSLDDIQGKKHAMFVDPDYAKSADYAQFWDILRSGQAHNGSFQRFRQNGEEIWIDATYAPVKDAEGKVERVIKIARDITDRHQIMELLHNGMAALSDGDLTPNDIHTAYDNVRELGQNFNSMVAFFATFVRQVRDSAQSVREIAGNLDQSSKDLARRSESQAATLEEVATAVHELAATAEGSLQRARESVDLANSTRDGAQDGHRVVKDVVTAMTDIEQSSQQIAKVLSVIDDIAFQTNLLALNAGVEAARAGEAGRGFAVVASEVRSLAQRAAESATEIKSLVGTSNEKVANGTQLVSEAGGVLERIFQEIGVITENLEASLTTLDEQNQTISEVNTATTNLSQVTERNAASTRQTADMSGELNKEAGRLMEDVSQFRLDETHRFEEAGHLQQSTEREFSRAS